MKHSTGCPLEADRVDRLGRPYDAGSVDGSFWDVVTIDEIDAKQSLPTFAAPFDEDHPRHVRMAGLPSAADSRR